MRGLRISAVLAVAVMVCLQLSPQASGQDLNSIQELLFSGEYSEAATKAEREMNRTRDEAPWAEIIAEAKWAEGKYREVAESSQMWVRYSRRNIRLLWLGFEAARKVGNAEMSQLMLLEMNDLVRRYGDRLTEPGDMVVIGRMALELGADPKLVVKNFFEPVVRKNPETRSVYLAAGQLALDKGDYALASKWFGDGLRKYPKDPAMSYGLARSFSPSDGEATSKHLERALELNPKHSPSKLLLVDMLLNSESFDEANELLDEVESQSPGEPEMWAYRAVISHLQNDEDREKECRARALEVNPINPRVPHIIGRKLSQQYRFREGSAYQRMALAMKDDYLPAKIQLAQDLLRLGKNDEGWKLATEVHDKDGYDVTAFNLVSLKDNLRDYTVVTNENFIIRVDAAEAEIIGKRALELLDRAHEKLTAKYGFIPPEPTTVEIFSSTSDFEVRTFGMPNIPGYLGVCFGPVITANSPSTPRMQSVNWEAVLWHEFCHTVTLGATRNRMPRWLSEGLSVYEEVQENPAWGMQLNPQFLAWIADGDLLPVSDLSAGFMSPKTPGHIEFAYFQSAQVVEFLLATFGEESMASLLRDLARGMDINAALEKNYASVKSLDKDFNIWLKDELKEATGKLTFAKQSGGGALNFLQNPDTNSSASDSSSGTNPYGNPYGTGGARLKIEDFADNFWTLMKEAEQLYDKGDLEGAESVATKVLENFPEPRKSPNPFSILSAIYSDRHETDKEIEILERWARTEVGPPQMYRRLIELARESGDLEKAVQYADSLLAIDPFDASIYSLMAVYSGKKGDTQSAIKNWEVVLKLNPVNPADIYYTLFELRQSETPEAAYDDLLSVLELAPRHQPGLQAFLKWHNQDQNDGGAP